MYLYPELFSIHNFSDCLNILLINPLNHWHMAGLLVLQNMLAIMKWQIQAVNVKRQKRNFTPVFFNDFNAVFKQ